MYVYFCIINQLKLENLKISDLIMYFRQIQNLHPHK